MDSRSNQTTRGQERSREDDNTRSYAHFGPSADHIPPGTSPFPPSQPWPAQTAQTAQIVPYHGIVQQQPPPQHWAVLPPQQYQQLPAFLQPTTPQPHLQDMASPPQPYQYHGQNYQLPPQPLQSLQPYGGHVYWQPPYQQQSQHQQPHWQPPVQQYQQQLQQYPQYYQPQPQPRPQPQQLAVMAPPPGPHAPQPAEDAETQSLYARIARLEAILAATPGTKATTRKKANPRNIMSAPMTTADSLRALTAGSSLGTLLDDNGEKGDNGDKEMRMDDPGEQQRQTTVALPDMTEAVPPVPQAARTHWLGTDFSKKNLNQQRQAWRGAASRSISDQDLMEEVFNIKGGAPKKEYVEARTAWHKTRPKVIEGRMPKRVRPETAAQGNNLSGSGAGTMVPHSQGRGGRGGLGGQSGQNASGRGGRGGQNGHGGQNRGGGGYRGQNRGGGGGGGGGRGGSTPQPSVPSHPDTPWETVGVAFVVDEHLHDDIV
ncbi:hypothetical protein Micbo1qcDRAFT_177318 [Microdochium bolleyi]|uniref:Uncharacterized protein n=1 Tax=Microdochium bolleyi TaxID=196109 RepID=A0A136IXK2_9PEZI|nr:hypothetical protein Micbo1qcDRAFT_177318 [Microdochium bolleyi]